MRYSLTVCARSLVPARDWRVLVPARTFPTLRAARSWCSMMRATLTDPAALLATEDAAVAFVVDEQVRPVLAIEMSTDPDAPAVERDRDELHEMRTTTKGTSR